MNRLGSGTKEMCERASIFYAPRLQTELASSINFGAEPKKEEKFVAAGKIGGGLFD
jgi:hypothetical protein